MIRIRPLVDPWCRIVCDSPDVGLPRACGEVPLTPGVHRSYIGHEEYVVAARERLAHLRKLFDGVHAVFDKIGIDWESGRNGRGEHHNDYNLEWTSSEECEWKTDAKLVTVVKMYHNQRIKAALYLKPAKGRSERLWNYFAGIPTTEKTLARTLDTFKRELEHMNLMKESETFVNQAHDITDAEYAKRFGVRVGPEAWGGGPGQIPIVKRKR